MSEKGGMIGGVNCRSGMIYGKYVLLQNAYEEGSLSLAEVYSLLISTMYWTNFKESISFGNIETQSFIEQEGTLDISALF